MIHSYSSGTEEIGIEKMTITTNRVKFITPEKGYNLISFSYANNCYIKDVTLKNCDNGVLSIGGYNNTFTNITFSDLSKKHAGHFGILMNADSFENLIDNVNII